MRNWVYDRLMEHHRAAKRAPEDKKDKKDKKWDEYRTGMMVGLDKWHDARALFAILAGAVTADEITDPKESATLESIVRRSRTFRRIPPDELDKTIEAVMHDLENNRWKTLEKATRTFFEKGDRQASAFMHALDVMHADQHLVGSEREFARQLADMLKINSDDAEIYKLLISEKNWSAGAMSNDQKLKDEHIAFFNILAGAVLIDLEERPDEKAELEALMMRTKTLSNLSDAARAELREKHADLLRKSFRNDATKRDITEVACSTLKAMGDEICKSAFIHAIDLAHADRALKRSEREYLDFLRTEFKLDSQWADRALELIEQKNKF